MHGSSTTLNTNIYKKSILLIISLNNSKTTTSFNSKFKKRQQIKLRNLFWLLTEHNTRNKFERILKSNNITHTYN